MCISSLLHIHMHICIYICVYIYRAVKNLLGICNSKIPQTFCICATLADARDWQPQIFYEPETEPEAKRHWTLSGRLCTGPGFGVGRLQQDFAGIILRGVKHGITWSGTWSPWGLTSSRSRGMQQSNFKVRLNWSKNSNWENLKNIASVEPREVTNQEFLQCYLIRASNIHFFRRAPRKLNYNI